MELQIHNVKTLSLKAELVDTPDDPYKVLQIKINGWSSVITLYCEKELELDLDGIFDAERNEKENAQTHKSGCQSVALQGAQAAHSARS